MKQRNDFVSNSSSSSFIVVKGDKCETYNFNNQEIQIPNPEGHIEFGWSWEKFNDFWSKLNFCAIQLVDLKDLKHRISDIERDPVKRIENKDWLKRYAENMKPECDKWDHYFEMLQNVCKKRFNLNIELNEKIGFGDGELFAYIDHQSSVLEGDNMEMFDSETDLYHFLASPESFIKTGNDNDTPPDPLWYDDKYN